MLISLLFAGYHVESSVSHFGRWYRCGTQSSFLAVARCSPLRIFYSLYQKEKRQHQMDYLKVITRHTFELNTDSPCTEVRSPPLFFGPQHRS